MKSLDRIEDLKKLWKKLWPYIRKNIKNALYATLVTTAIWLWQGWLVKSCDRKKYNKIELQNPEAETLEESNNNTVYLEYENWETDTISLPEFLDKILEKNWNNINWISSTDLITTMTSENALKTDWPIHKIDWILEDFWVERSKHTKNVLWRPLSFISNWSYWRFQTQREAIKNWYINDLPRYNNICKKIANFKLPDNTGERVELYKQFGYNSDNEMIDDIKSNNLPIYKWGNRLWIAFWIVLLNEQLIDRNKWWERFNETDVINRTQNIKSKRLRWLRVKDPIRQALSGNKGENLKTIYILSKEKEWVNRVSFKDIEETLQSPEFRAWEVAAWWCTSIEARKNCEYLLDFNIAELNQYFNEYKNGKDEDNHLEIVTPTGGFWPTSTKLAIKHLKEYTADNPSLSEIINEAEKNEKLFYNKSFQQKVKKYLNEHPEIIKDFKNKSIEEYIRNFRTFFLLNENWDKINDIQMNFLENNLNLSFNHLYVWVQYFKKYVKNKKAIENLDTLRNKYVINQDKTSREKITKILTHKDEFITFTWLSEKKYWEFIKHHLWPALLWISIILSETWNVVPECQEAAKLTSNEINTIFRFYTWAENQITKMNEDIKWIPIVIETENFSINKIRQTISENVRIMEYLKNNCRTPEWDKITNINQISDKFIYHFIGLNQNKIDSLKDKAIRNWDKNIKIYFKTRNIKQIIANEKYSWIARKKDNFCNYIYDLQQQNPRLAKILKNIIWKDQIELKDITKKVLKQIIRDSNWHLRKNLNKLHPGDQFIIVLPLNKGEPKDVLIYNETTNKLYNIDSNNFIHWLS